MAEQQNESSIFRLPIPKILTQNKEGADDNITDSGIDKIESSGEGSSGGGGIPEGFGIEVLDVCEDDGTAGKRQFLTAPVV